MNDYNIKLSYDSFIAGLAAAFIEGRDRAEYNDRFEDSESYKEARQAIDHIKLARGQK